MRNKTKILFSLFLFFISFTILFSQTSNAKQQQNEVKSETKIEQKKETKKIWNAYCPVMGDEVDAEVKTVEYKGKVIGFCCKSCIKKFQKDPEKYLKNLSPDGQKFIKK